MDKENFQPNQIFFFKKNQPFIYEKIPIASQEER